MNVDFSSAEDKVEIAEITPTSTPNIVTATTQWKNVKLSQTIRKLVNEYGTTSSKKWTQLFINTRLFKLCCSPYNNGWIIYVTARRAHSVEVQQIDILVGIRPVIEVSKKEISY